MRIRSRENTFSYSKLSGFEQCPQRFNFEYISKIPRGRKSLETFVGSVAHDVMDWLYTRIIVMGVPTRQSVVNAYEFFWEKRYPEEPYRVVDLKEKYGFQSKSPQEHYDAGSKMLTDYYDAHYPFADSEIIRSEMHLGFWLTDQYYVHGYIDRLSRLNGLLRITDYKTANTIPSHDELDYNHQLTFYEMMIRANGLCGENEPIELEWVFLRHNKSMLTSRTVNQLDEAKKWALNTIEAIDEAKELDHWPARLTIFCEWCHFQDSCDAYKASLEGNNLNLVESSKPHKYLRMAG